MMGKVNALSKHSGKPHSKRWGHVTPLQRLGFDIELLLRFPCCVQAAVLTCPLHTLTFHLFLPPQWKPRVIYCSADLGNRKATVQQSSFWAGYHT